VTKRKTSIQINGSHYDALTGALLSYEATPVVAVKPAAKSIDGVVGGSTKRKPTVAPVRIAAPVQPVRHIKPDVSRAPAAHAKTRQAKPSATLMRHAVKKPTESSLKRNTTVRAAHHAPNTVALSPRATVVPKHSLYSLNHERAARAASVQMHPRISRFSKAVEFEIKHEAIQIAQNANQAFVLPQNPVAAPAQTTSDIFERALQMATSHEEPAPVVMTAKGRRAFRSLRRRMVSFGAGAVAVLALVGVFGYHSDPVKFKMATTNAGFSANMPGYSATGFQVADVQTTSGYVNVKYHNKQLNRTYAVVEKPSSITSSKLLEQIAATETRTPYNAVDKDGRTIYIYGRNQAAWVHEGILYQVLGNGSLASDDFVAIATSM
jgi:hypothetical protein